MTLPVGFTIKSNSPWTDTVNVTKSDSTTYDPPLRGLYVGGGGDVAVVTLVGTTSIFKNVPSGTLLPVFCTRVNSTNTTATDILGGRGV